MTTIYIQQGFTEEQRGQVGALYFAAFAQKLTPLLGADDRAIRFVAAELDPACCFIAADADGKVLGVAGFQHGGSKLVNIRYGALVREYGWLGGTLRGVVGALFERHADATHLQMDGIAVHPDARGLGIGTRLLDALTAFAAEHGYKGVRLEVVDSNMRARRLYERVGFAAVKTAAYPYLRSLGFTAVTTMEKSIAN
jgi:ribosomal protein S18 acetylase RimI-like enzyme